MSGLTKIGLSMSEVRKAGAEARVFLGNDPPIWKDLGDDRQKARMSQYLDHLRETENSAIAEQLAQHSELLRNFLRNQTKAQRSRLAKQPVPENVSESAQCDLQLSLELLQSHAHIIRQ